MPVKVYGHPRSPYTLTVATVLSEKKVPFELIQIETGGAKTPEHLEKNPFGQTPYIVSTDFLAALFLLKPL